MIAQFSGIRGGPSGVNKSISNLAKVGLIAKIKNAKYDGYRLTYGGLDYLAMHNHTRSGSILHLGSQMGVGKESDIYLVRSPSVTATNPDGSILPEQAILKLHRLGRTSFRSLSNNRAYKGNREHCTWQQLSKLSAEKEFAAMRALYHAGYAVPRPIAHNRHTIVMSLVPGMPLRNVTLEAFGEVDEDLISSEEDTKREMAKREKQKTERDSKIAYLYEAIMEQALSLAEAGVIHGDFNEFNILISHVPDPDISVPAPEEPMAPILIDFPQITSFSHPQAQEYFDRDIECIKSYFRKRYHFESSEPGPSFEEALERRNTSKRRMLDVEVEAMGFNRKKSKLEEALRSQREDGDENSNDEEAEDVEVDELEGEELLLPQHDEQVKESDEQHPAIDVDSRTEPVLNAESMVQPEPQPLTAESLSSLAKLSLAPQPAIIKQNGPSKPKNSLKKAAGWAI